MRLRNIATLLALGIGLSACALDDLLNTTDQPNGAEIDPSEVTTYSGALRAYYSAIEAMALATVKASEDVGYFTDELAADQTSAYAVTIDARANPFTPGGVVTDAYGRLQTSRVRAGQAAQLLLRYGTAASAPMVGHAYAMQAQSVMMLAEMFCSGVPLTAVPFAGDLQYTAGISTTDMLERAVALFDTAYSYGKDSLPIATFAQVGKGRALLSLDRYADAAAAVAAVPTTAQYTLEFSLQTEGVRFWPDPLSGSQAGTAARVLNREGANGIQWATDMAGPQDPRVPLSVPDQASIRQQKYTSGAVSFVVADGIQARMIEAEAQLQPAAAPAGPWLATLNAVRAERALSPLTDPGTAAARVDLVFRERAFWFYLNGQRLGDLRRLVRNYNRLAEQVYSIGVYPQGNLTIVTYGNAYVFDLPQSEQDLNPLYKGCIDERP